jgi:preprotein translocase subunit SecY
VASIVASADMDRSVGTAVPPVELPFTVSVGIVANLALVTAFATIFAVDTELSIGVRASDSRGSVVITAVPVTDAGVIPPAAIFAVVTVPSVGVRVFDSRESLPSAAVPAVVPYTTEAPDPAAASSDHGLVGGATPVEVDEPVRM